MKPHAAPAPSLVFRAAARPPCTPAERQNGLMTPPRSSSSLSLHTDTTSDISAWLFCFVLFSSSSIPLLCGYISRLIDVFGMSCLYLHWAGHLAMENHLKTGADVIEMCPCLFSRSNEVSAYFRWCVLEPLSSPPSLMGISFKTGWKQMLAWMWISREICAALCLDSARQKWPLLPEKWDSPPLKKRKTITSQSTKAIFILIGTKINTAFVE